MKYRPGDDSSGWKTAGRMAAGVWLVGAGLSGLVLLISAEMPRGRLAGLAMVLLAVLPGLVMRRSRSPAWLRATAAVVAMTVVMVAGLLWATPSRAPRPAASVTNWYAAGTSPYGRWAPANIVPELDQLRLGFTFMSAVDPIFTAAQAAVLRRHSSMLHHEMAGDPDFRALGSVMSDAYAEFLSGADEVRHCYVYVPADLPRERPAPLLVFFHGSGGNFKAYLWILKEVADRNGCVLVAPTNGMGYWRSGSAYAAIDLALAAADGRALIDPAQVHAIGLSNGGNTQLLALAAPVRSIIAISPVLGDVKATTRPILIITGDTDDRVPVRFVRERVDRLRQVGGDVSLRRFPDADHFLFFTHRAAMVREISSWLLQHGAGKPPDIAQRSVDESRRGAWAPITPA